MRPPRLARESRYALSQPPLLAGPPSLRKGAAQGAGEQSECRLIIDMSAVELHLVNSQHEHIAAGDC